MRVFHKAAYTPLARKYNKLKSMPPETLRDEFRGLNGDADEYAD
jgi:hypothetical protein